uniref:Uncharacterized protein n=1 Tax=Anguilla anguilla TaxID=7936 RepID=A0A0E9R767_ANGAN
MDFSVKLGNPVFKLIRPGKKVMSASACNTFNSALINVFNYYI